MPVIKVWCLPAGETEDNLRRLHQSIVAAVVAVKELGLRGENDMTCLFPSDRMLYGLGEEIVVEISGLFVKPERTSEVLRHLATNVGRAVKWLYRKAKVECFISSFDSVQGFWTSAELAAEEDKIWEDNLRHFCGVDH